MATVTPQSCPNFRARGPRISPKRFADADVRMLAGDASNEHVCFGDFIYLLNDY